MKTIPQVTYLYIQRLYVLRLQCSQRTETSKLTKISNNLFALVYKDRQQLMNVQHLRVITVNGKVVMCVVTSPLREECL